MLELIDKSISCAGGSDKGRVRQKNEDCILLSGFEHSNVLLLAVADGVGGHAGGDIASHLAVDSIKSSVSKAVLQAHSGGGYSEDWLQRILKQAIWDANSTLISQQKEQPDYSDMATTIVALLIHENKAALSYLGDSRCYQYDSNCFKQMTEDHTVLQKLLNEGKISQQEFAASPMHHMISKALGLSEFPEVEVTSFIINDDTIYLLCSDGLTNCISDAQIQDIIQNNANPDDCVDELITRANDNGGSDNISVVLVKSGAE